MSSAANHKRGPLEEEFQRRMHDAEASPSPDLWARIDHDLTIQESNHYKGRMVFYRQLAAACFVLFAMAGALLTYHFKEDEATAVASVQVNAGLPERKALTKTEAESLESVSMAEEVPAAASIANSAANNTAVVSRAASKTLTPELPERAPVARAAHFVASNNDTKGNGPAGAFAVESGGTTDSYSFTISGDGGGNTPEAKSAFTSLRPFYQTARQAIAAVPPSFSGSFGRSAGQFQDSGQPKSVVELSRSAKEEITATLRKSEELALALNNNTAGGEDKKGNPDSPWTLGMGYAPSYFNQNIGMPEQMMGTVSRYSLVADGPDKTAESSENMEKARNEFEENTDPAFSYAVDVKAGFKLGKKLKLLSGIGFTQNTSRTKSSYIIKQFWFKPDTDERVAMPATTVFLPSLNNNFSTDSLSVDKTDEDFYVNYRYRHVTLPVGLQYEGGINKDWFWYASGGVAANFLVETTVMASNNEVKDVNYDHGDESPFRKVQFSGNVSLGVGKRVSSAISVTAGPEFRGYFNSLLAEPEKALAPQGRPYTVGVNMSVNYDLGRR